MKKIWVLLVLVLCASSLASKKAALGGMDGFVESLKKRETDPYSLVSDLMGEMLK